MKKILFAFALCTPSAFCGMGNVVLETALAFLPDNSSFSDILNKASFGSGAKDAIGKVVPVISALIRNVPVGSDKKSTLQSTLCRKGDASGGTYSLRSFNGIACIYPPLGQFAEGLCSGYSDNDGPFTNSDCYLNYQSIKRKMGAANVQAALDAGKANPAVADLFAGM